MKSEIKNNIEKNLFNKIAKYYGLFFKYQRRKYHDILDRIYNELNLYLYSDVADIGCGTGAFCSELLKRGFTVTGLDSSIKMLDVAKEKLKGEKVELVEANFLNGLPFEDKSFDVSFASFVAHGLQSDERKKLYQEMDRITRHMIIIYDYNEKRSIMTNILERLEGGDYFNFTKNVKKELQESFYNIRVIDMGDQASCYVIKLER